MAVIHDQAGNAFGKDNPIPVTNVDSHVMQPVDIQGRYAETVVTHNAAIISPSGSSAGSWIDVTGFDKVIFTGRSDTSHALKVSLQWSHDGVGMHSFETKTWANTMYPDMEHPTKARYFKAVVYNDDATNPHTVTGWVYLKA